jgi:hypothetical protein
MGEERDGALTVEEASIVTEGMRLNHLDKPNDQPICTNRPPEEVLPTDLPLEPTNLAGPKHNQFVGLITEYRGGCNFDELEKLFKTKHHEALPEPMRIKGELMCPHTMQVFVVPKFDDQGGQDDEEAEEEERKVELHTIIKHIFVGEDTKLHPNVCVRVCQGDCMSIDYGKQKPQGVLPFQYMLEKLGKWQMRYRTIATAGTSKKHVDRGQREE